MLIVFYFYVCSVVLKDLHPLVKSMMTNLPNDLLAGLDLGEPTRFLADQQSSSNSSSLASFPLSYSSDSFIDDFVEPVN